MAVTTTRTIELSTREGYDLSVLACGEGPCVILIHGFPLDATFWHRQMQPLADAGCLAIAPDLRGFGRSGINTDRLTPADSAEDIERIRQHVAGEQPVVLVGVSMGGYIALESIARFPQTVAGLVLCNTKPGADSAEGRAGREAMAAKALAASSAEATAPMIPRLLCEQTRLQKPHVVSELTQWMERVPAKTIAAAQRGMAVRRDFTDRLPFIQVPTTVIAGEFDPIAPAEEGRTWASRIPNAAFEVIESAGHLPQIEQPEAFNAMLLSALRRISW